jgi:hypothetical protein
MFFAIGNIIRKLKLSSSIAVVLQASQTAVVFYHFSSSIVSCNSGFLGLQLSSTIFSSSIVTELADYSGYNYFLLFYQDQRAFLTLCELPTSITNFKANYFYIKFQISSRIIMSSLTKREIAHDPREIEPKHRRSSRLNRKHPGSHSGKSFASMEAKKPKIFKSSSSKEKAKLETLYIPNKGSPKVIKIHEDTENSKCESSS